MFEAKLAPGLAQETMKSASQLTDVGPHDSREYTISHVKVSSAHGSGSYDCQNHDLAELHGGKWVARASLTSSNLIAQDGIGKCQKLDSSNA